MSDQFEFEPSPLTPTIKPKKRNPLDLVLVGAAVIALAGVAFATGRLTAPAPVSATSANGAQTGAGGPGGFGRQRGSFDPNASFAPGQGGFGGGQGGLGGAGVTITGKVVSVSATAITIQLSNGTEVNIPIDSSTAYHSQTSASSSDVKTGLSVEIQVTGGFAAGGGNRQPGASAAPLASGAPRDITGTATSITIIPN